MTHCTDSRLLSEPANFRRKTMQCMTTVSCIFTNRKWLKWLFTWNGNWKCKKLNNGRITWEIGQLIHVRLVLRLELIRMHCSLKTNTIAGQVNTWVILVAKWATSPRLIFQNPTPTIQGVWQVTFQFSKLWPLVLPLPYRPVTPMTGDHPVYSIRSWKGCLLDLTLADVW